MKQVILRIRDSKNKLKKTFYYTSQSQFNSYAVNDILDCGLTDSDIVELKVGTLFNITFNQDWFGTIFEFIHDYSVQYYVKQYLPLW